MIVHTIHFLNYIHYTLYIHKHTTKYVLIYLIQQFKTTSYLTIYISNKNIKNILPLILSFKNLIYLSFLSINYNLKDHISGQTYKIINKND